MVTVPAHNLFAPVRACVMAAARFMPSVCGVLESSWSARTIFTPCSRQSIFGTLLAMINYIACRLRGKGVAVRTEVEAHKGVDHDAVTVTLDVGRLGHYDYQQYRFFLDGEQKMERLFCCHVRRSVPADSRR